MDSGEKMEAFRAKYKVPSFVRLELLEVGVQPDWDRRDRIYIPVVGIVEGGVWFPLNPFFRHVLHTIEITTVQLSTNFFRIVNRIA